MSFSIWNLYKKKRQVTLLLKIGFVCNLNEVGYFTETFYNWILFNSNKKYWANLKLTAITSIPISIILRNIRLFIVIYDFWIY